MDDIMVGMHLSQHLVCHRRGITRHRVNMGVRQWSSREAVRAASIVRGRGRNEAGLHAGWRLLGSELVEFCSCRRGQVGWVHSCRVRQVSTVCLCPHIGWVRSRHLARGLCGCHLGLLHNRVRLEGASLWSVWCGCHRVPACRGSMPAEALVRVGWHLKLLLWRLWLWLWLWLRRWRHVLSLHRQHHLPRLWLWLWLGLRLRLRLRLGT